MTVAARLVACIEEQLPGDSDWPGAEAVQVVSCPSVRTVVRRYLCGDGVAQIDVRMLSERDVNVVVRGPLQIAIHRFALACVGVLRVHDVSRDPYLAPFAESTAKPIIKKIGQN